MKCLFGDSYYDKKCPISNECCSDCDTQNCEQRCLDDPKECRFTITEEELEAIKSQTLKFGKGS